MNTYGTELKMERTTLHPDFGTNATTTTIAIVKIGGYLETKTAIAGICKQIKKGQIVTWTLLVYSGNLRKMVAEFVTGEDGYTATLSTYRNWHNDNNPLDCDIETFKGTRTYLVESVAEEFIAALEKELRLG